MWVCQQSGVCGMWMTKVWDTLLEVTWFISRYSVDKKAEPESPLSAVWGSAIFGNCFHPSVPDFTHLLYRDNYDATL